MKQDHDPAQAALEAAAGETYVQQQNTREPALYRPWQPLYGTFMMQK
jgi:hypothetical protein